MDLTESPIFETAQNSSHITLAINNLSWLCIPQSSLQATSNTQASINVLAQKLVLRFRILSLSKPGITFFTFPSPWKRHQSRFFRKITCQRRLELAVLLEFGARLLGRSKMKIFVPPSAPEAADLSSVTT